jgi:hypothetical protein
MEARRMKTMQEVLAEHQISVAWESGDDREITCLCGTDLPSEDVRGEIDMNALAAHQSAALSAAGFGLVADAKAEAWDEGWAARAWRDPVYRVPDTNPYRATP